MKKHNPKKLPEKVLQHNCNQTVHLSQEGKKKEETVDTVEIYYTVVCKWIHA